MTARMQSILVLASVLVGACFATTVDVPERVPDWALQASLVYRAMVGVVWFTLALVVASVVSASVLRPAR